LGPATATATAASSKARKQNSKGKVQLVFHFQTYHGVYGLIVIKKITTFDSFQVKNEIP